MTHAKLYLEPTWTARWRFWLLFSLPFVGCARSPCPEPMHARTPNIGVPDVIHSERPLAVLGDLQGTLFWEKWFLFRECNERATEALVCQLGGERPSATVLLGDLVTWGASERGWQRFDELADRISGPLLPVRGNHEYFGDQESASAEWLLRFPWFDRLPWYRVTWDRIGLVFLNSNLDELLPAAQIAQQHWYERELDRLDQDPLVAGTLVFLHHPPFTNNPNAQGKLESLREAFVSPLCRHTKALAMIAGHAHGYERYAKDCGKRSVQFIVSGGGGGPRPNDPPCFRDECLASGCCDPRNRPLHYLLLERREQQLEVTVQALRAKGTDGVLEVVRIPLGAEGSHSRASSVCAGAKGKLTTSNSLAQTRNDWHAVTRAGVHECDGACIVAGDGPRS